MGNADTSNIAVFLAVMRAGSTLAASRELGVSQATAARKLEALEREIGLELFERDTRGTHPTGDAVVLAESANRVEAALAEFAEAAENLRSKAADTIRIAAPSPNFSKQFSEILADYSHQRPGVQFSLLPSDQAVEVDSDGVDVAILYTHTIDDPNLICRRLGVEQTTMFASDQYVSAHGLPAGPDDLRQHAIVGVQGDNLPTMVRDWLSAKTDPDQISTKCDNIASLVAAVQMGKGVGPLPATLGDQVEGCIRCFDPPEELDLPIWLVIGAQAYRRPAVKAFTRFFAPRYAAVLRRTGAAP